ncbi:MAG TPA: glycosyltransferase family 2 protein [Solirubrobacteraceae bacterium]|jgi:glycosyltransferase involved in cell wall biosynthesis
MTSSSDPLVSILTPSFNQGRFLGDCLASVAAQDYSRIEQVVQDGGSTDGSVELLMTTSEPVAWASEPDGGQAEAINRAFARSQGSIIGWINSDDALFSVDAVSAVVREFENHPDVHVIFGDAAMMSADGRLLRHFRPPAVNWRRPPYGWSPICQPAAFIRRDALRPGEPLLNEDLHLTLDVDLWLRLRSRGCRFLRLSRTLAADRDHGERKVRTLAKSHEAEWARLEAEHGIRFVRSGLTIKAAGALARLAGVPSVVGWKRRYRPAFPWSVDTQRQRLARQIASTHASLTASALER